MGRIKQTISPKENDELYLRFLGRQDQIRILRHEAMESTDPYNYTTIYTYDLQES